jgi:hypothetical protein
VSSEKLVSKFASTCNLFRYDEVPPALASLHGFMRANNVSARDVFSAVDTDGSGTLQVGLSLRGGVRNGCMDCGLWSLAVMNLRGLCFDWLRGLF